MKSGRVMIITSTVFAILICATLAACGAKQRQRDVLPAAADFLPDSQPEVSAPLNRPDDAPQDGEEDALPVPEDNTSEPSVTEDNVSETVQTTFDTVPSTLKDEGDRPRADTEKVVTTATEQLGVEYALGGDSPDEGFDSSGFVYYCMKNSDITFPRQIKDQLKSGEEVAYNDLRLGDAVYFSEEPGESASFCGIYAGGGLMIYSSVPGDTVKTANITTNYWTSRFVTGIRPTV